jgi:hypothetical protein
MANDMQAMQAANAQARAIVLQNSVPIIQKIASLTQATAAYVPGQATVLNIPLQNVGIIKRLWVKVTATTRRSAAETHTRTALGPANFLSQILLTDLNNLVRINTSGWHLSMVNAARRQSAYGAAYTTDTTLGFGSNYSPISAPASFTTGDQTINMVYELPIAYSDNDLRGAIFANVVNATMNLQLTINPQFSVASTGNGSQACYKSSSTDLALIPNYTIEVYQEYLDQLPKNGSQYILPTIDLATQYNLLNITQTGIAPNADFGIPYGNFRSFMSTVVMYDNGGTLNPGSDINYFMLSTANSLNLFKLDPKMVQFLNGRLRIYDDFPLGVYYFSHRDKPLTTLAYGNMQMNINPSTVNANAQFVVGYEFFALQNQLQQAGSITGT